MTILRFSDIKDAKPESNDGDVRVNLVADDEEKEDVDIVNNIAFPEHEPVYSSTLCEPVHPIQIKGLKKSPLKVAQVKRRCMLSWLLCICSVVAVLCVALAVYLCLSFVWYHYQIKRSTNYGTCGVRFAGNAHMRSYQEFEDVRGTDEVQEIRPNWITGNIIVLHHLTRNFTLISHAATRRCFIRPFVSNNNNLLRVTAEILSSFAKVVHEISPRQDIWQSWKILQPALSVEQILFHGPDVYKYCRYSRVYKMVPMVDSTTSKCGINNVKDRCQPCPNNAYIKDLEGCSTCVCAYNFLEGQRLGLAKTTVLHGGRTARDVSFNSAVNVEVMDEGVPIEGGKINHRYLDIVYWD